MEIHGIYTKFHFSVCTAVCYYAPPLPSATTVTLPLLVVRRAQLLLLLL